MVIGPSELIGPLRPQYAYLLGLYLGDGCVYPTPSRKTPRTARFDVYLDARYPAIVGDCLTAMTAIHPRQRAKAHTDVGCTTVTSFGLFWFDLFPQNGPGRKHTRKIELVDWQLEIVDEHRWEFFRGLIDSDGSRFDRVVGGRAYPAYEFANNSTDIIRIFCDMAQKLGVHYTIPDWNSVSIATRNAVQLLDSMLPFKDRPAGASSLLLNDAARSGTAQSFGNS